jgi:hypothetical protein
MPDDTVAVVVTHRRRRLATTLVHSLLLDEGFRPDQVTLVIDRDGGLESPSLEAAVRVVRLAVSSGPAAGFRAGLDASFADPSVRYAYLCEDDVGLMGLPVPRVADLRAEVDAYERRTGCRVGAVLAYGRRFGRRRGTTAPFVPDPDGPRLQPVDVGPWGAVLVSRRVHDAGIRPDDHWFFAYEDFDYYLRTSQAGLDVLIDRDSGLATAAATTTLAGRNAVFRAERPDDTVEPWRAYYVARNMFELARRYGDSRWVAWHLIYSGRRFQLASSWAERRALLIGLRDGVLCRSGRDERFVRVLNELPGDISP